MVDKTWKAFERRVAKKFNGKRRGADYADQTGGKTDIIAPGFSVEVKNWSRPTWAAITSDVKKSEERREKPTDIPLAIMKKVGDGDDNAIVCMRLETFMSCVYPLLREKQLLKELGYERGRSSNFG